jgi:hypothetical protein
MRFFDFIKNGGLFGKMRGYDSDREGHWYGFDEFIEDITKCSNATEETAGIPGKVQKNLLIENNEKQNHIASNDSEI